MKRRRQSESMAIRRQQEVILSEKDKLVLQLREEGLSYSDIGKRLLLSVEGARRAFLVAAQRKDMLERFDRELKHPRNLDSFLVINLPLSVRARNCFIGAGVLTLGVLKRTPEREWRRLKNFGERAARETRELLAKIPGYKSDGSRMTCPYCGGEVEFDD